MIDETDRIGHYIEITRCKKEIYVYEWDRRWYIYLLFFFLNCLVAQSVDTRFIRVDKKILQNWPVWKPEQIWKSLTQKHFIC